MSDMKGLFAEFNGIKETSVGLTNDDILLFMLIDRIDTMNKRLFELKELHRARL